MTEENVKKKLIDQLLKSDDLPEDDLTIEKILHRGFEFTENESAFSFKIMRHPGFNRNVSRGKGIGLSAYFEEMTKYTYNVDTRFWKIEVIESNFEYDYRSMAIEEIDSLEEGGFLPSQVRDEDVESVISEVLDLTENYFYEKRDDFISDEDFKEMLNNVLNEMRKRLRNRYSR